MWGTVRHPLQRPIMVTGDDRQLGRAVRRDSTKVSVLMMNSRARHDRSGAEEAGLLHEQPRRGASCGEAEELLIESEARAASPRATCWMKSKDKMVGNEAALGRGLFRRRALRHEQEREAQLLSCPKEGSNVWVDGMCIPEGQRRTRNAPRRSSTSCAARTSRR